MRVISVIIFTQSMNWHWCSVGVEITVHIKPTIANLYSTIFTTFIVGFFRIPVSVGGYFMCGCPNPFAFNIKIS